MSMTISFTPPTLNPAMALAALTPIAAKAGADHLLAASQPLVPVDTGELLASGRVEAGADGAAVIYDAKAKDDYAYGIRQHEDMSLHHTNGGQAKYLEQPFHEESTAIAALIAAEIRKAL